MDDFVEVISQECNASQEEFWNAIQILLRSPHLINRRILTSVQLSLFKLKNVEMLELFQKFQNVGSELFLVDTLEKNICSLVKEIRDDVLIDSCITKDLGTLFGDGDHSILLHFAKLLPRCATKFSQTLEIVLIDLKQKIVMNLWHKYVHDHEKKLLCLELPNQIIFRNNCLSINVLNSTQVQNDNLTWLKEFFFCKLLKWIENAGPKNNLVTGSLNLISSERYTSLYMDLKTKYGSEMVKIWPENTDPSKFVYEDVAIATYLLLLWEEERNLLNSSAKQSFLDLGCGNGLLVHILNSEGHPGLGIDLRKRKIWDLYPESTKLEVRTIIPSSKSLFPQIDWLIGNHSDELTPWIPVIAARSSHNCRFFLLPCCAYEFDGRKYQRESATTSQYFDYMQYIKSVSETCGFQTAIDKLRIPSTKRICLIGTKRNYDIEESDKYELKIQDLIDSRCNGVQNEEAWSSAFKPRETTERVRNCTKIDKNLVSTIVEKVVSLLLRKARMIKIRDDTDNTWNAGTEITLSEVASAIDSESLKELKKECGGLQTLLRNNGHIFKVESGKVRFRIPGREKVGRNKKSKSSNVRTKVKPCWFHENHPDGCPVSDDECDFKH